MISFCFYRNHCFFILFFLVSTTTEGGNGEGSGSGNEEADLRVALSFEGFHWKGNDGFHDPTALFERTEISMVPPWREFSSEELATNFYLNPSSFSPDYPGDPDYVDYPASPSPTLTASPSSPGIEVPASPLPTEQETKKKGSPNQQEIEVLTSFPSSFASSSSSPSASSTSSTTLSSSSFTQDSLPPWFNKMEFVNFNTWYFQELFKEFEKTHPLTKILSQCYLKSTQPPPSHSPPSSTLSTESQNSSPTSSSSLPTPSFSFTSYSSPFWNPFDISKYYRCIVSGASLSSLGVKHEVPSSFSFLSSKKKTPKYNPFNILPFPIAANFSFQFSEYTRALQTMSACFDIRSWIPQETIVTKISHYTLETLETVTEDTRDLVTDTEVGWLPQPSAFPSFLDSRYPSRYELDRGYLHEEFWNYLPLDSADIKKVIHGSCAIVSGAGELLDSELGEEIDSHDTVIRFSTNPTKGFEKHVGSKTTLRPTSGSVAAVHWNSTLVIPYIEMLKELRAHWLPWWENKMGCTNFPDAKGLYEPAAKRMIELLEEYSRPELQRKLEEKRQKKTQQFEEAEEEADEQVFLFLSSPQVTSYLHMCMNALHPYNPLKTRVMPTTGIRAVVGVLPYCDSVNLYGFSYNKDTTKEKKEEEAEQEETEKNKWKKKREMRSHYYSDKPVSQMHKVEFERRFIQMLVIQGLVNIKT